MYLWVLGGIILAFDAMGLLIWLIQTIDQFCLMVAVNLSTNHSLTCGALQDACQLLASDHFTL